MMKAINTIRKRWGIVVALSVMAAVALSLASFHFGQGQLTFAAPPDPSLPSFSSPLPVPTPTPPPSHEAEVALRYVAERYGTPVDEWVVANEHRREYKEIGRAFQAFSLLRRSGDQRFVSLMVDLEDYAVVEDAQAIEQLEREAYQKRYGKLDPVLYQRLQDAADTELVEVAIWIAGRPRRTQEELFAELAARFPAARQALEKSGKPFDIPDSTARAEVERAYAEMSEEDGQVLVQPLVDHLKAQGYAVTTFGSLPSVSAILPKHVILALAERPDVGRIFFAEGEGQPLLDTAVPSDRVSPVWRQGFDGTGTTIAVLENGNVDFTANTVDCPMGTNNCFRHPGQVHPGISGETDHATLAASAAGSDHSTHKGVAPGAMIHSAGMTVLSRAGLIDALGWALGPAPNNANADVVNISYGFPGIQGMDWVDWSVDYWARHYWRTIVVAAGNYSVPQWDYWLTSPAKAWNIVTVGNYDNVNNANWTDDVMNPSSCYVNPGGDREKPEVVAPGTEIMGIELNGVFKTDSGTSYAAPQTAGLAALLIDRDPSLRIWSESAKAIMMASAVHNVLGPSGIPSGQELRDGAGGIDATLADRTAQTHWTSDTSPCTGPCWWGISITNDNFPVHTYLSRSFKASQGTRIRVAATWWSNANCPDQNNCFFDRLDTDLDLNVLDPDGNPVSGGYSASWDNNYELVEFPAPKTGVYTIGVWKKRADESSNYLGLAWTEQATYLPDVKSSYDGWDSEIVIRNDSAEERDVKVTLFSANGSWIGGANYAGLPSGAAWTYNSPLTNFSGSAVVNGSADVSVVVHSYRSSDGQAYSYDGIASYDPVNPGWGQVGTDIHVPLLMNNNSGWSTKLVLLNTSSDTAYVTVKYYGQFAGGPYNGITGYALAPHGSFAYDQTGGNCPTICGGHVTSSQPLAVTVRQYKSSGSSISSGYGGFSSGATTASLPLIMANNSGWYTGIVVQNLGLVQTTVTIRYYPAAGFPARPNEQFDLQPHCMAVRVQSGGSWPDRWIGSARVTANQPLAAIVNQADANSMMTYDGFPDGTTVNVLPE